VKAKGGRTIISKAGHSFIKDEMKKYNARLGAEKSGHYYFKEFFYADSPLLACLNFIEILTKEKKKVSEVMKEYEKYVSSDEINFKVKDKERILNEIERSFK